MTAHAAQNLQPEGVGQEDVKESEKILDGQVEQPDSPRSDAFPLSARTLHFPFAYAALITQSQFFCSWLQERQLWATVPLAKIPKLLMQPSRQLPSVAVMLLRPAMKICSETIARS